MQGSKSKTHFLFWQMVPCGQNAHGLDEIVLKR